MLEEEKQVKDIQEYLQEAMSRKKSYYDPKHREVTFEPGEYAYLRVTPMRGVKKISHTGNTCTKVYWPLSSDLKKRQNRL